MTDLTPSAETIAAENNALLERLAELKTAIADSAKLKKEYDEIRDRVQFNLQLIGADKTKPHAGVYVTISHTPTLTISDPDQVAAWLEDNVIDVMDYYKLDSAAITALATETLADSGEIIPGTTSLIRETASVLKAKT